MRLSSSYAREKHQGQFRKYNPEPYFNHVNRVADLVKDVGGSEKQVDAAFLHDTIEDCGVTVVDLIQHFGKPIAYLVLELTNVYTKENYPKLNREKRTELEHARLAKISPEAKLIKLADRLDNLKDIMSPNVEEGFRVKYAKESLGLVDAVGDAHFGMSSSIREIIGKILGHELVSSK